jgi:hypothetical protein
MFLPESPRCDFDPHRRLPDRPERHECSREEVWEFMHSIYGDTYVELPNLSGRYSFRNAGLGARSRRAALAERYSRVESSAEDSRERRTGALPTRWRVGVRWTRSSTQLTHLEARISALETRSSELPPRSGRKMVAPRSDDPRGGAYGGGVCRGLGTSRPADLAPGSTSGGQPASRLDPLPWGEANRPFSDGSVLAPRGFV